MQCSPHLLVSRLFHDSRTHLCSRKVPVSRGGRCGSAPAGTLAVRVFFFVESDRSGYGRSSAGRWSCDDKWSPAGKTGESIKQDFNAPNRTGPTHNQTGMLLLINLIRLYTMSRLNLNKFVFFIVPLYRPAAADRAPE